MLPARGLPSESIEPRNFAEADHLLKCWGAEPAKVSQGPRERMSCQLRCEWHHPKTSNSLRIARVFGFHQSLLIPPGPVGFFKFPTTPHIFDLTNGKAGTHVTSRDTLAPLS